MNPPALCELCDRAVGMLTEHHLVPRQTTKRRKQDPGETIDICSACHRQIHHLFSNRELADRLNSLPALKEHPEMGKFLAWVRKQDPNKRVKVSSRR